MNEPEFRNKTQSAEKRGASCILWEKRLRGMVRVGLKASCQEEKKTYCIKKNL